MTRSEALDVYGYLCRMGRHGLAREVLAVLFEEIVREKSKAGARVLAPWEQAQIAVDEGDLVAAAHYARQAREEWLSGR